VNLVGDVRVTPRMEQVAVEMAERRNGRSRRILKALKNSLV
jgi:hypothetical protein